MAKKTKWICDGCGESTVVEKDKTPADWKHVAVTWAGLAGYPGNLIDGGGDYDLCRGCARQLAETIRPPQWPRATKALDEP